VFANEANELNLPPPLQPLHRMPSRENSRITAPCLSTSEFRRHLIPPHTTLSNPFESNNSIRLSVFFVIEQDTHLMTVVWIAAGSRTFHLHHQCVQIVIKEFIQNPTQYVGQGSSPTPGLKRQEREPDHSGFVILRGLECTDHYLVAPYETEYREMTLLFGKDGFTAAPNLHSATESVPLCTKYSGV